MQVTRSDAPAPGADEVDQPTFVSLFVRLVQHGVDAFGLGGEPAGQLYPRLHAGEPYRVGWVGAVQSALFVPGQVGDDVMDQRENRAA